MLRKWKQFVNWVSEITGGNPVKISEPLDNTGNTWDVGESEQVQNFTHDPDLLTQVVTITGLAQLTKNMWDEGTVDLKKRYWYDSVFDTVGQAVSGKIKADATVATSKNIAESVSGLVKVIAFIAGAYAVASLVIGLFKKR